MRTLLAGFERNIPAVYFAGAGPHAMIVAVPLNADIEERLANWVMVPAVNGEGLQVSGTSLAGLSVAWCWLWVSLCC